MPYQVIHRPDGLLQRNNARDYAAMGLAETFIGKHTAPAHQALERFVDERLANRTFGDDYELRKVLEEWPLFYLEMNGSWPHKDWSGLEIGLDGMLQSSKFGPGGKFVFALVEKVEPE